MRCEDLEPIIEGVADGTLDPGADAPAHIAACPLCGRRVAEARAIHELLATREVPAAPPGFTTRVMALVQRERWQAERAIDIGFNLAVAAGVVLILSGGLGLAWSMGFLALDVNLGLVLDAVAAELTALVPQMQTIAVAAVLLTMALGLWWWAETDWSI